MCSVIILHSLLIIIIILNLLTQEENAVFIEYYYETLLIESLLKGPVSGMRHSNREIQQCLILKELALSSCVA